MAATCFRLRSEAGIGDIDETPRSLGRSLVGILDAPDREDAATSAERFVRDLIEVLDLARLASACHDRRDQIAPSILDGACEAGLTMSELAGGRAPGRLVLTTYHSAKGREFSAVVLPGLVERLVPFYFTNQGITVRELSRARRQFYVAVTRAIDAVVLVPGTQFTAWGRTHMSRWSRFVDDIQEQIDPLA